IVKATDLEKLGAAGLSSPAFDWLGLAGHAVLIGALIALAAAYLRAFLPAVWASPRQLALLYLLIALAAVAAKVVVPERPFSIYTLPIAAVPMLVTTLIDPRAALLSTVVMAVFIAQVGPASHELITLTLVGGIAGVLGVWRCARANDFLRAGVIVGAANVAVVLA